MQLMYRIEITTIENKQYLKLRSMISQNIVYGPVLYTPTNFSIAINLMMSLSCTMLKTHLPKTYQSVAGQMKVTRK